MDRVAVLLGQDNRPVLRNGSRVMVPLAPAALRRTAHVSGNQVDVFHCPFCGSGDVVARSDGSIQCSFCESAFTVTISPIYPSFPMSVGGQPYPWPGRPEDPAMMGDPGAAADGNDGFGGSLIPGGGAGGAGMDSGDGDPGADDEGDGPPWADSGDSSDETDDGDESGDKDEATVGGRKKPPFGKKSSSRLFRTATGGVLPRDEYLRHLAIATAHDPNAMAARIRAERSA